MEENQLRKGGPEAPARALDSDFVGRAGKIVERYKVFWFLITGVLVWWGRTVVIPLNESAKTTAEVRLINLKIDSVMMPKFVAAENDRRAMIRIQEMQTEQLGVLTRLQCLRTSLVDRAKINLNCRDIPIEFPKNAGRP